MGDQTNSNQDLRIGAPWMREAAKKHAKITDEQLHTIVFHACSILPNVTPGRWEFKAETLYRFEEGKGQVPYVRFWRNVERDAYEAYDLFAMEAASDMVSAVVVLADRLAAHEQKRAESRTSAPDKPYFMTGDLIPDDMLPAYYEGWDDAWGHFLDVQDDTLATATAELANKDAKIAELEARLAAAEQLERRATQMTNAVFRLLRKDQILEISSLLSKGDKS